MYEQLRQAIGPVGVWFGALSTAPAAEERGAVAAIEELGYGALWFGEAPGTKEVFAHAGVVLGDTERIVVATGIAGVYSRDATAASAGANTLAEAFPGRFVLGLGVSHAPAVERRGHGYGRPIATMRAYLDAMDAAEYRAPLPPEPVPQILAALRPRMLELADEEAIAERVRAHHDVGADHVAIQPLAADVPHAVADLTLLAPALL